MHPPPPTEVDKTVIRRRNGRRRSFTHAHAMVQAENSLHDKPMHLVGQVEAAIEVHTKGLSELYAVDHISVPSSNNLTRTNNQQPRITDPLENSALVKLINSPSSRRSTFDTSAFFRSTSNSSTYEGQLESPLEFELGDNTTSVVYDESAGGMKLKQDPMLMLKRRNLLLNNYSSGVTSVDTLDRTQKSPNLPFRPSFSDDRSKTKRRSFSHRRQYSPTFPQQKISERGDETREESERRGERGERRV